MGKRSKKIGIMFRAVNFFVPQRGSSILGLVGSVSDSVTQSPSLELSIQTLATNRFPVACQHRLERLSVQELWHKFRPRLPVFHGAVQVHRVVVAASYLVDAASEQFLF